MSSSPQDNFTADEPSQPPRKRIRLNTMAPPISGYLSGSPSGSPSWAPPLNANHTSLATRHHSPQVNKPASEDEHDAPFRDLDQGKGRYSTRPSPPLHSACSWPKDTLPLELFDQIAKNLPFSDQWRMRLVNKEFNSRMNEVVMKTVTLSYHPDIIATGTDSNTHVMKLGRHFRRFVIASEVSDLDFLSAPVVSSQTIVTTWWGVYRWPAETSPPSMYSALEESCRDPSRLAAVFHRLQKTNSLGICLDSGLGYLSGTTEPPVCCPRVFARNANQASRAAARLADAAKSVEECNKEGENYYVLRKMFMDSGFKTDAEVREGIRLLRFHEGKGPSHLYMGEDPHSSARRNLAQLEKSQMWMVLQAHLAHRSLIACLSGAMLQAPSFAEGLVSLRISRLSSSLIADLSSHAFWECLSHIHTLFFGVVPDWRRIDSLRHGSAGAQVDINVAPVSAVGPVFDLLNDYIAPRANITSIHFEWVCGGELSPEGSQYNRYILPVPFSKSANDLLLPSTQIQSQNLLLLPHVRSLSLKNAWCTPEIFTLSILSMNRSQLRRLDLESVSLSGQTQHVSDPGTTTLPVKTKEIVDNLPLAPSFKIQFHSAPPSEMQPERNSGSGDNDFATMFGAVANVGNSNIQNWLNQTNPPLPLNNPPTAMNGVNAMIPQTVVHLPTATTVVYPHHPLNAINTHQPHQLMSALNTFSVNQMNAPVSTPLPPPMLLACPNLGTWAHFVDLFTPEQTIADFQSPDGKQDPPRSRTHAQLLDMTFKSCGYVFVGDFRVDNNTVLPKLAYANVVDMLLMSRPGDHPINNNNRHGDALPLFSAPPVFQVPEEEGVLGEIIRYLDPDESITLERVFGLKQTWHGVYGSEILAQAHLKRGESWSALGQGRFSGTISASPEKRLNFTQVVD